MKFIFLTIVFLISNQSFAKGEAQIARFEPWLQILEESFGFETDAAVVAKKITRGQARVAAFNLQALGEIYEFQSPDFKKKVKNPAKELEDGIGQVDFYESIYKKTKSPKDLEALKIAETELAEILKADQWVAAKKKDRRIEKIREFLQLQKWKSYSDDKKEFLGVLSDQLKKIDETKFDLTRLEKDFEGEDGNGLHELRREIRWFLINARVSNGLVQFRSKPEVCEIPEYQDLYQTPLASSKYSALPPGELEKDPCYIEQCQFLALSKAANDLGDLKDQAELIKEARETDQVPAELAEKSIEIEETLKSTDIFGSMRQQIKSCLK